MGKRLKLVPFWADPAYRPLITAVTRKGVAICGPQSILAGMDNVHNMSSAVRGGGFLRVLCCLLMASPAWCDPVLKEPPYKSEKHLYLRMAFGEDDSRIMWAVFDESQGTGKGYDQVYVDADMDNDLSDGPSIRFPPASRPGQKHDPRFSFKGPMGDDTVEYELNVYSLARKTGADDLGNECYFFWSATVDGWRYFLINGRMRLFPTPKAAAEGEPVRLGGKCHWEINTKTRGLNVSVSAGLKDPNGCTLRSVNGPDGKTSPQLTLMNGDSVAFKGAMGFG
jgi:hypothetical protein